jgi:helicase
MVVDECHLIGSKERGPRLETAIMRYNMYNPNCRFILMSATCPNTDDYKKWLTHLTKRETVVVVSDYRPCKLNKHFVAIEDTHNINNRKRGYDELENERMKITLDYINQYPSDQWLIFTGNKNWGKKFSQILLNNGFNADFHNADLGAEKRHKIEKDFNDGKIQYLIASSTLAWGVNVNARRVLMAHTTYGLTEMEISDIEQACGRAGRVKYHTEGDAYILIPASKYASEKEKINAGFTVQSKLNTVNTLMFHVVNEINNGNIKNEEDLYHWYENSLAFVQKQLLTENACQNVLNVLETKNMIRFNEEIQGYETTQLGNISSIMYQHPLDVSDWYENFSGLKDIGIDVEDDAYGQRAAEYIDIQVCMALADIYENNNKFSFISSSEKNTDTVVEFLNKTGLKANSAVKVASVYYAMLNNEYVDDPLKNIQFGILNDLPRTMATLKMVHQRYGNILSNNNNNVGWQYSHAEWDVLFLRLKYGVTRKFVSLVSLPEIGAVYARKLYDSGVKNKTDVINNKNIVEKIIGHKRSEKLYNSLL